MFSFFTDKESLEDIIFYNDDKYPNWKKIIGKNFTEIYLDISNDELKREMENDESPLWLFSIELGGNVNYSALGNKLDFNKEDTFINFIHPDSFPHSVFVSSTISEENTDYFNRKTGLAFCNIKRFNDNLLTNGFYKELEKGEHAGNEGWKTMVNSISITSNATVISDPYLLSNEDGRKNAGIENCINLFDSILPGRIDIEYHITLICEDNKKTEDWCLRKSGELITRIKKLRPYEIKVEVFFMKALHKRVIIQNYIYGSCDKGFSVFNTQKPMVVRDDNDFRFDTLFKSINFSGDTEYESTEKLLKRIKKNCDNITERIRNIGTDMNCRIIGDCNKDKSVRNRLLSSL